jgi:MFS transporter, ACS family, tartrate transporter
MSAFFLTIPLSGVIGAPIAAILLQWGRAALGIAGWRSLFTVEGLVTVGIGIVVLLLLPNRPQDAPWLTDSERDHISTILAEEAEIHRARGALSGMAEALTSRRVWALALASFSVFFGLYPLAFFLPAMISSFTQAVGSNVSSVLLAAIPSLVAIVVMLAWTRVARRRSAVFSTAVPMAIGAVGLVAATATHSGPLFILAVCASVSGIYAAMPQFWRIPPIALTGAAAAAGIGLINSVSNLSGLVGPYLTGAIKTATGSYTYALLMIAAVLTGGLAVLLTVGRRAETAPQPTPTPEFGA